MLLSAALCAILGQALWPVLPVSLTSCLLGMVGLALLGLHPRCPTLPLFAALGFLFGAATVARIPNGLALPPGEVVLRGEVVTAAQGKQAAVRVGLVREQEQWKKSEGRVLVWFPESPPPVGSVVSLSGKVVPISLERLPGEADMRWSLARSHIQSRVIASEVIVTGAPMPRPKVGLAEYSGLLEALVTGNRSGLSQEQLQLLSQTGTSHLLSVSGLHIGLGAALCWKVGGLIARLLTPLWRRGGFKWFQALLAIGGAYGYAWLAGMQLPALRAVWAVGAASICLAAGLVPSGWALWGLGALACLAADPDAVGSLSAQLSFGALAGMLVVFSACKQPLSRIPARLKWLAASLLSSFGATLGTLPFIAWTLQSIPLNSPIANLWAGPLLAGIATPAVLVSQVLPGSLGLFCLAVADSAAQIGMTGLELLMGPMLYIGVGWLGMVGLCVGLILSGRKLLVGLCWMGAILAFAPGAPEKLQVWFLSIGQGDAALVRWPDGRNWLIDGGPPGRDLAAFLHRLGLVAVDEVILSHPHPDHLGGLEAVFKEFKVERFRIPRLPRSDEPEFLKLVSKARRLSVGLQETELGMELLHPRPDFKGPKDPVNDESLVLRLSYGQTRFLFVGDIEAAGEKALLEQEKNRLSSTVLKVPHHGSKTSSSSEFVQAVSPELAVISCGQYNRYRHPSPITLAHYRKSSVLRTDQAGTILVESDGTSVEAITLEPGFFQGL